MPFGITNITAVTWNNITNMTGSASLPEFAANVNHIVYNGWLYFVILLVLAVVLFYKLQDNRDQILINLMYSVGICAVLSLFLRAIEITRYGATIGLLTDFQMWIFPLIAITLAAINWAIKDRA